MFAKKSRKEAKKAQENALATQNEILRQTQAQAKAYQDGFSTRNAGIIDMNKTANDYIHRYNKGEDVASLNPALAKTLTNSANQTMNTLKYASAKLGDTAGQGDAGYNSKMLNVTQREIGKNNAMMNMQGLENEVANQRGIALDTANFLNADSRAGFGMQGDVYNMASGAFAAATTKRQMEMQRSNMMMSNMMGLISGGVSGFMTAGGAPGIAKLFGAASNKT